MAYKQKRNPFLKKAAFKNHIPGHGLPASDQIDIYSKLGPAKWGEQYTADSLKWVDEGWGVKEVLLQETPDRVKKIRVWEQKGIPDFKDLSIETLQPKKPEPIKHDDKKEIQIGEGQSIASKTKRDPTYAYQQYRGFQIPVAMNIWDESSNSWKRRPMEPEEIEYETNKVRKRTGG